MSKRETQPTYSCPICGIELKPIPRYPRYVCRRCKGKACSIDGRSLVFSDCEMKDDVIQMGVFVATYADSKKRYNSHDCYIDGIRCYADEARFGGIVIQVVGEPKAKGRSRKKK